MHDLHRCFAAAFMTLMVTGQPARAGDPVTYRCDDGSEVMATFIAIEPPAAIVVDHGTLHALGLRRSGSGARYATGDDNPDVSFWTKGEEALFAVAGELERICKADPR